MYLLFLLFILEYYYFQFNSIQFNSIFNFLFIFPFFFSFLFSIKKI